MSNHYLRRSALALLAIIALLVAGCSSTDDNSAEPSGSKSTASSTQDNRAKTGNAAVPEVSGPVTGGQRGVAYNPMPPDLADQYGYVEEEYFISGDATAYQADGDLGEDGVWDVTEAGTAPYTTRILVRRPADPADFNGTVLVEWLNVSAGRDSDPDFGFLAPELLDDGYAYVGVSAQSDGIAGGAVLEVPGAPEEALLPLQEWDPERYASLDHPGNEYSYDIFSQAAQLVRTPGGSDILDGLEVQNVIAAGESQSAFRMVSYVNAIQPVADVFDGFLIHSRGDAGAPLGTDSAEMPAVAHIRTDLDAPVLQFQTETDLGFLSFVGARQPDSPTVVTWEVAGTAHADQSTIDYGAESGRVWTDATYDPSALCGQINNGPQAPVVRAAFAALVAWANGGAEPPTSEPIETSGGEIVRDELGNAIGGIRTPAVDAPTSTLTGEGNESSVFCVLFGQETPLSAEQLAQLYSTHDDYVAQVTESADAAVEAGFLLAGDRDAVVQKAEGAAVPG